MPIFDITFSTPLVRARDVMADALSAVHVGDVAPLYQLLDGLERQVGVDRPRAVPEQQRHVVRLARLARSRR